MNPPINWINTDATDKSSAILTGYTSTAQPAVPPQYYPGDVIQTAYAFLAVASQGAPNPYVNLDSSTFSGFVVEAAVLGQTPDGGSFILTGGSGATEPQAYPFAASALQSDLRNDIIEMVSCTVTGPDGGPFEIDSQDTANPTLDLTANEGFLAPDGSRAIVVKTQVADGTSDGLTNRWVVTLVRAFLVYQDTWSPLDPVAFSLAVIQPGHATAPLSSKSFSLKFNPDAIGGAFNLTATAPDGTTTGTIGPIPFNVDEVTFAAMFASAPGVVSPPQPTKLPVQITQNGAGDYTITAQNDWANDPDVNLVEASNTLQVPMGYQASITVSVAGALAIFEGSTDPTADITLTMRLTPSVGQVATVVQTTATLYRSFPVGGSAGTGAPSFLNVHTGVTNLKAVVGYTGGGTTKLNGITSSVFETGDLVTFFETTVGDGQREFAFANPDASVDDGVNVITPLDNTSARWLSRL